VHTVWTYRWDRCAGSVPYSHSMTESLVMAVDQTTVRFLALHPLRGVPQSLY
jgi:hypothetical protein